MISHTHLRQYAARQLAFFRASVQSGGGIAVLDAAGAPIVGARQELHTPARLAHSYALAHGAGFDGCADIVDAGLAALWRDHRDKKYGGYVWAVQDGDIADGVKLAYGHVFVLLAAASAKRAGYPDADRLMADVMTVIDAHYWDTARGLLRDEFQRDWRAFSDYRGMNANMHGVEAFLAAFEATGNTDFLSRARTMVGFFVGMANEYSGRIPEHYNEAWQVVPEYEGNPMFRPAGTTPGHSFEWARLMFQYVDACRAEAMGDAAEHSAVEKCAESLIAQALKDAWCEVRGGFIYTLNLDGTPDKTARYWWPITEAIGALAVLYARTQTHTKKAEYLAWYRRVWAFADANLIDHARGGWYPELDNANRPTNRQFVGKPDIYHALQACLFSLELEA